MRAGRPAVSDLVWFVVLTFALAWGAWLAVARLAGPELTGIFGANGPLVLLAVFAPAFVALGLTAREHGSEGVSRLLARIGRWQVDASWYVFAIVFMPVTKLLAAIIHRAATGAWPAFGETRWLPMLGGILVSIWVQAGEEIGWRGYALPRFAQQFGLGRAALLVGVIWAVWHLPLFYLHGSGSDGQSFPLYLLHVTALSVVMTWMYWKTNGSLLLVMLMHASINNTTAIVPAATPGAANPLSFEGSIVAWATVILWWVAAIPLLLKMRRADISALGPGQSISNPR